MNIQQICESKARDKINTVRREIESTIKTILKDNNILCKGEDPAREICSLIVGTGNDNNLVSATAEKIMKDAVDHVSRKKTKKKDAD